MTTPTTTAASVLTHPCPKRTIEVRLPLAAIEDLDQRAASGHISRQELLRQILAAALLLEHPGWPAVPEPIDALSEQAFRWHIRSLELRAAETAR